MKVLIEPDNEVYPYTFLKFAEEIRWPAVPEGCEDAGVDVPDELARKWRVARDAWIRAQEEAEEFLVSGKEAQ